MWTRERERGEGGSLLRCLGFWGPCAPGKNEGAEVKQEKQQGWDCTGSPASYFLPLLCIASVVIISLAALGGRNVNRRECFSKECVYERGDGKREWVGFHSR